MTINDLGERDRDRDKEAERDGVRGETETEWVWEKGGRDRNRVRERKERQTERQRGRERDRRRGRGWIQLLHDINVLYFLPHFWEYVEVLQVYDEDLNFYLRSNKIKQLQHKQLIREEKQINRNEYDRYTNRLTNSFIIRVKQVSKRSRCTFSFNLLSSFRIKC